MQGEVEPLPLEVALVWAIFVLDFNFAYNPSCCYDPRWVCPLAPPGNRLPIAVRGGERYPD